MPVEDTAGTQLLTPLIKPRSQGLASKLKSALRLSVPEFNEMAEDHVDTSVHITWSARSATATDVTDIILQFKDRNGVNITHNWTGLIFLVDGLSLALETAAAHGTLANGLVATTGGAGFADAVTAEHTLLGVSDATGRLDLDYNDASGFPQCRLGIMVQGHLMLSETFQHGS